MPRLPEGFPTRSDAASWWRGNGPLVSEARGATEMAGVAVSEGPGGLGLRPAALCYLLQLREEPGVQGWC